MSHQQDRVYPIINAKTRLTLEYLYLGSGLQRADRSSLGDAGTVVRVGLRYQGKC